MRDRVGGVLRDREWGLALVLDFVKDSVCRKLSFVSSSIMRSGESLNLKKNQILLNLNETDKKSLKKKAILFARASLNPMELERF